jgi:predicted negative regulator of RcsB-dependent stress response
MATLQTQDANILDAEEVNWRRIVYPLLALLVILGGGIAFYFYQQDQRDETEAKARAAILTAKTPADLVAVADRFPGTTQADFALIAAGGLSLNAKNYDEAQKEFGRVANATGSDAVLKDSAQLGVASTLEAHHQLDDAAKAFLVVARRGDKSPYAAYAYGSAARIYEEKKDTVDERQILTEAAALRGDSDFVKEAQSRLKMLNTSAQTPVVAPVAPVPTAPATNASTPTATHPSS